MGFLLHGFHPGRLFVSMSIRIMAKVWALNIPSGEKFVALALADNASDEGVCWPLIETIAKKTSTSERSVIRHIERLREIGLVATEGRGHKRSLKYTFDLSVLDDLLRGKPRPDKLSPQSDLTCQDVTSEGGFDLTPCHPEPSVEEPSDKEPAGKPAGNLPRKVRARDPIVDQLVIESGGSLEEATDKEYTRASIAAASIRKACPNVTAEDIRARASEHRRKFHFATTTAMAIAGAWSQLAPPKSPAAPSSSAAALARRQEIAESTPGTEVDPAMAAEFFAAINGDPR